jgi:hypothetical protein
MPAVSDELTLKILPRAVKLQDSYRAVQGIRLRVNVLVAHRWVTLGVRDWGLFRWEQQETCVQMSVYRRGQRKAGMDSRGFIEGNVFIEGDKKRQEWWLSSNGAFYLGPGPILWLN